MSDRVREGGTLQISYTPLSGLNFAGYSYRTLFLGSYYIATVVVMPNPEMKGSEPEWPNQQMLS